MELMLRGDPEGCVKSPASEGRALRFGETAPPPALPGLDLFRRPRFFPSCPWAWQLPATGLCLLQGDCFTCPVLGEIVKMILLLASFSASEKAASHCGSPFVASAKIF